MSDLFDTTDPAALLEGMRRARTAIASGKLIVLPTDTVYGVGANAFSPAAVSALLTAKGRSRQSPPPVLIPGMATVAGLAIDVPDVMHDLTDAFWPGGLTIILDAQPSLTWDLGDSNGTVALRVPNHPIALELLAETGPLAVSSANLTGEPAALTATEARRALGDSVDVYLESGPTPVGEASTILDLTPLSRKIGLARILRLGAIGAADLRRVLADRLEPDTEPVG